ncbi:MAG: sulfite exporter TauE/SafE family protein [Pseudomonadota bacterium]|nr:sulfite exporter TauE/SafE family protein [Pseudomonadota bacterium]
MVDILILDDIVLFIASFAIAVFAGILSGIFGIGGGIFFVPTINFILKHYYPEIENTMLIANNTSLACILCLNSVTLCYRRKQLDLEIWQIIVRILLLGSGAFLGGGVKRIIDNQQLSIIFGAAIFIISLYYLILPKTNDTSSSNLIKSLFPMVFLPISFLTSLLGIGGAIFLFPLQLKIGFSKEKSAATSTLSTVIVSSSALIWYFIDPTPPIENSYFIGDIFWPMMVIALVISPMFINYGIKLNKKFSKKQLNKILGLLLALIGILHLSL